MGIYKRGKTWWIDYYYQGERVRERVGPNKQTAEDALDARKGEIAQGRFNLQAARPSPLLEDFAKEYLEWARLHHRTADNTEASRLRILLAHFPGKRLRDLTPWLIEGYKHERARALRTHPTRRGKVKPQATERPRQPIRPATVNRELAVLSSLLTKAVEWGKLAEHPMKGGKVRRLPQHNLKERILTPEEETRLLKASGPELQDLISLALDTGMRLGELVGLTPAGVDLARAEVRLQHTKNRKERRIPLTARAVGILTDRARGRAPDAPYFPPRPGKRPWRLASAFGRACTKAEITGLRFHDLRHTFATRLVQAGVDLVTVRELLGHGDLRMTSRYTHASRQSCRQAIAALEREASDSHKTVTTRKGSGKARRLSSGF